MNNEQVNQLIYHIKWLDAAFNSEDFIHIDDISYHIIEFYACETIGFYLKEDHNYIVLADTWCVSKQCYRHIWYIPKKNILIRKRIDSILETQ